MFRDLDEKLTSHPSEYLRVEDERLFKLDTDAEKWWNSVQDSPRLRLVGVGVRDGSVACGKSGERSVNSRIRKKPRPERVDLKTKLVEDGRNERGCDRRSAGHKS